jgi:hypothetical protein
MEGIPRERGVQGKLDPVALIGVASRLRDEATGIDPSDALA